MTEITLRELADKIGVSSATISLVLNNKAGISESTREYVQKKVKEYGYEPLRAYKQRRYKIYLLICKSGGSYAGIENTFFTKMTESIESAISKYKAELFIKYIGEGAGMQELKKSVDGDGLIVQGTFLNDDELAVFLEMGIPVLVLDNSCPRLDVSTVSINNGQGIRKSIDYLLSTGHKKIGFIRNDGFYLNNFAERFFAFRKIMREYGLEEGDVIPVTEHSRLDVQRWAKRDSGAATAYIVDTDLSAFYIIKSLRENGVSVPDDISIVGFDNNSMCEVIDPPLTTVNVPIADMGRLTADRIMHMIENPAAANSRVLVDTNLVIRNSVRPVL